MGRGEIQVAYHYLYVVEIFDGLVLLALLLEIYKFVIMHMKMSNSHPKDLGSRSIFA